MKTACFTGKRPQSMPWGFQEDAPEWGKLKRRLEEETCKAISLGYLNFISGMALGIDLYAAEFILHLKRRLPGLSLEAAIPCRGQTAKWTQKDRLRYEELLKRCDKVTYVGQSYTPYCMQRRNQYMVDRSDLVIAVYNGTGGGTANTIRYARQQGKRISLIEF